MAYLRITHIRSYAELDQWMQNGSLKERAGDMRVVGYHTVARRLSSADGNTDVITIRQWNTDIYTLYPNNIAVLNTGGWMTVSTKQRLNDLIPISMGIYSEKGRWFVRKRGVFEKADGIQAFADGIQINVETAEIVASPNLQDWMREDVENAKMKRKIAKYVKGLTDEKVIALASASGSGDCFDCQMHTIDGQSLGDKMGETTHLLYHIEEGYYMSSLNLNALREGKRGNPYFCMRLGWAVRHDVGRYLRKRLLKGVATQ